MAASSPDHPRRRPAPRRGFGFAAALAAACFLPLAPPPAAQQRQQQEITLDAASSDFDRRNERLVFREIRVRQGDIEISADEAESRDLDFSRGSWSFRGNVRISSSLGDLQSERATITFTDHRLDKATADGAPAQFSRTMPGPESRLVTGTANRIVYDLAQGQLELVGQALLQDGLREVSGGRLEYRIVEDRLIASADETGERVRIVITPPDADAPAPPQGEDGQP
jgi:lipopolysaccharide transport protein LptA